MADTILPAPVDMTALDFFQLVERVLSLGESARPELDWRNKASLERLLGEGTSTLATKIVALMNNQGREHFWGTAYLRQSVFRLMKRTAYRPRSSRAGRTNALFTVVSGTLVAPVEIGVDRTVRTEDAASPVIFQVMEPVSILPGGDQSATGLIEHSSNASYTFEATTAANQKVRLPIAPYLDDSASFTTPQGTWTEVRNFLRSGPTDLHFWTEIDAADRCIMHFGDNNQGAIPSGIGTVTYRYGGGLSGNVAAGAIRLVDGSYTDTLGNPVQIAVTNPERIDNGDDRESTPSIKLRAPLEAQSPRVSVARGDYVTNATAVAGVARAMLLTRNQDPGVRENEGLLYIVPKTGDEPSTQLLADVAARFGDEVTVGDADATTLPAGDRPKTVTFQLRVRAVVYRLINVTSRIWLRQGANPATVRQTILDDLADFFALEVDARTIDPRLPAGQIPNPRIDFGARLLDADGVPTDRLAYSDVYNVVRDARGVLKIGDAPGDFMLNDAQADAVIARPEFPKLGTVVLINAKTNQNI